ncbi:putative MFS family arabinose efflux permease [Brevibacterium sanguinis]|uniref:MFS family arabinose efflux permease n=2 Tax=Brevibacterium TaxID=1696 RepID=A0ABX9GQN0_9MICO|nr:MULTISPECIES: MFS transporter [Brevibacterium]RBP65474.1 putative MFS family arabinose efflux permease [Brevibacterium sanguinis]RBP72108.1 putative MFS family arabinose efflux permease [Brevibacterium celere]
MPTSEPAQSRGVPTILNTAAAARWCRSLTVTIRKARMVTGDLAEAIVGLSGTPDMSPIDGWQRDPGSAATTPRSYGPHMRDPHAAASGVTSALLGLVWSAMFGFSAFFFSYSTMVTIGGLHGLSSVTAGSVLTTMMIGVIGAQPFAPWVGRVVGLRGALLLALGMQMLGQVIGLLPLPPLLGLAAGGLCGGVGFGLFVVLANAAVPATVTPGRIGMALGLFGGITSLASALGAPFGLWLVGAVPLWAFRTVVCLTLLLAVPTVLRSLPGRVDGAHGPSAPEVSAPEVSAPEETTSSMTEGTASPAPEASGTPSPDDPATEDPVSPAGGTVRLIVLLLPFLIGMVTFGLIVGFGPGTDVPGAAFLIGAMQVSAVIGRLVAGGIADRVSPFLLNIVGIGIVVTGLVLTAVWTGGPLFAAMGIVGLGLGTMQSASLVLAFAVVSTPARASVAWNMNFDIGLAIAGVLGGIGFTYLGDSATFLLSAGLLLGAGVLVVLQTAVRRAR